MLSEKLSKSIARGKTQSVYANVTNSDRDHSVTVFDNNLSSLCKQLRGVAPNVSFRFNSSAEKYEIGLEGMTSDERKRACRAFADSPLSISNGYHFGSLF